MRQTALSFAGVILAAALGLASPAAAQTESAGDADFEQTLDRQLDIARQVGAAYLPDQMIRGASIAIFQDPELDAETKARRIAAIGARMQALDAESTQTLNAVFDQVSVAELMRLQPQEIAGAVWTMLQHTDDVALQERMLAETEPLARDGVVDGNTYAMLVDQVLNNKGEKQIYGTNAVCADGAWQVAPLQDPDGVEARRADLGMMPLSEYLATMRAVFGPCGG